MTRLKSTEMMELTMFAETVREATSGLLKRESARNVLLSSQTKGVLHADLKEHFVLNVTQSLPGTMIRT